MSLKCCALQTETSLVKYEKENNIKNSHSFTLVQILFVVFHTTQMPNQAYSVVINCVTELERVRKLNTVVILRKLPASSGLL